MTQRARILRALKAGAGTSSELAAETGLSPKHCAAILSELWACGRYRLARRVYRSTEPRPGRVPFLYEIEARR